MDVKPRNANPRDLQPELELKYIYVTEVELKILTTLQDLEFKVNILKTYFTSYLIMCSLHMVIC